MEDGTIIWKQWYVAGLCWTDILWSGWRKATPTFNLYFFRKGDTMKKERKFSTIARIWLILCIIGGIFSVARSYRFWIFMGNWFSLGYALLYIAFNIWLLLGEKKLPFYFILGICFVRTVISLLLSFKLWIAVGSLVVPLITYIVIRSCWKEMKLIWKYTVDADSLIC